MVGLRNLFLCTSIYLYSIGSPNKYISIYVRKREGCREGCRREGCREGSTKNVERQRRNEGIIKAEGEVVLVWHLK